MLICRKIEIEDFETRVPIIAGYRKCGGCACTGFRPKGLFGSSDYCQCGHHFDIHGETPEKQKEKKALLK